MVDSNGVFHMKTAQERELERRVSDRKRELMESHRAQEEQRKEASNLRSIEKQRPAERPVEYSPVLERSRGAERDEMEGRVAVSQVSNGLHSAPALEKQSNPEPRSGVRVLKRTRSFGLNPGKSSL